MPALVLRRMLVPALLATTMAVSAAAPATAAPAADGTVVAKAAALLAHDLGHAGSVVGSYDDDKGHTVTYTDYGRTIDAALALLASGGHDGTVGRALTTLESHDSVVSYTQGAPADKAGAAYVGATAKLAFVVAATGGDPTKVGGVDLIGQLTSLETPDGRFADNSTFGNSANVLGHSFALLALVQAGQTVPTALVQGLASAQCPDRSFAQTYPKAGSQCTGSVDATGLVLQALAAVGQSGSQPTKSATSWLTGQERSDGSFPGQAPVNSTGYAVLGLDAVAAPIGNALAYLADQQNSDGGLRTGAAGSTASNEFATSQALPALSGKTLVASVRTVARQAVLAVSSALITARGATGLSIHAPAGSVVDVVAYSRPSTTFRIVRSGTADANGVITFTLSLLTNTRLYAQTRNGIATPQEVVGVRTGLSLSTTRSRVRTIAFSGRSIPARSGGLVISLYRYRDADHQVLTAQTRSQAATGNWTITRAFAGTGTFDFVVRAGSDLQNAAGASTVQSVHIF
ncbi:MAG: hypothetical protein NVS3B26_08230 [Mycobacteriales bacterium]